MRRAVAPLAICLLLLGLCPWGSPRMAAAAEGPIGVRKPMPKTLKGLEARLTDLADKINTLVAKATKDPAETKIAMYSKYGGKDWKNKKRVTAEDLVEFMVDPNKDFIKVRQAAKDAILSGRFRGDPDLNERDKRGGRTKRAYFCWTKVVKPYIREDKVDRLARKLCHELLIEMYAAAPRTHPEIRIYNPDNEKSWTAAYAAWDRYLKKN